MNAVRIASCAALLLALGFEVDASDVPCFKNHYILGVPCDVSLQPFPQVPTAGRWTAIGPDGANVMALVIDPVTPSTAFAGTIASGVLKTTDGGASWATANVGLATTNIVALVIDPSTPTTLYAATDMGVFKSTDGGQSWAAANQGLDWGGDVVYALAVDPRLPATLYAGTPAGIFKTTNGAATWTPVNAAFEGQPVGPISIDPTVPSAIYISVATAFDVTTVFKSIDGGASWASIYVVGCDFGCADPPRVAAVAIDPQSPSRLYLLAGGGLKASADGGASWSDIATPLENILLLSVDPTSFATAYVHTSSGATYRTSDAGKTWTSVADGPLTAAGINAIAIANSATIYAGGSTGVFRSIDGAQTWTHLTLGVKSVGVSLVAVDPGTPSTIYALAGLWHTLTKTTDGGSHWAETESAGLSGRSVDSLTIDPVSPSTLYALTHPIQGGGSLLYKTTDAGAQWTPASDFSFDLLDPLAIAPTQPSTLYLGDGEGDSGAGILKSTDGGVSWVKKGPTAHGQIVSAVAVDPTTADTVYAATLNTLNFGLAATIFKSTDGATHWALLTIPLLSGSSLNPLATIPWEANVNSLAVDPAEPSTVYATYTYNYYYDPAAQAGILKSSDRGATWVAASGGLPPTAWVGALVIGAGSPSQLYAATSAGVFRSTDGATSWTPINVGLPNVFISNLSIDRAGSILRTATNVGLFEYKLSDSSPSASVPVIEYYDAGFDHYFITANPNEIVALDSGDIAGWTRTGFQFHAYATGANGTSAVCRFFSTAFAPKSSHFYTPFASECAAVKTNAAWLLESDAAFYIATPAGDGSCAAGSVPVFRLYNSGQGGAPNHRYTTDLSVRAQMIEHGWAPEGFGPSSVEMCSPP